MEQRDDDRLRFDFIRTARFFAFGMGMGESPTASLFQPSMLRSRTQGPL